MPISTMLTKAADAKTRRSTLDFLADTESFIGRHIGPSNEECREMLDFLELSSLDELADKTVPQSIRLSSPLQIGESNSEHVVLSNLRQIASMYQIFRSFIGIG